MRRSRFKSWLAAIAFAAICTPVLAQDEAADLVVRLNRLEGQVRSLSGQIEQLQFDNRQLKDQLRKFQEDTEFRFQERSGGARSGAGAAPPSTTPSSQARPGRRSDAFDPETTPAAPGAPRVLGSAPDAGRIAGASPDARAIGGNPDVPRSGGARGSGGIASIIAEDGRTAGSSREASVAATGGDARGDYDSAYASYTARQYEQAEMGFRRFLQSHPRDRLVPDATYWLGESYLQRNRAREAAEQFLKISTDYSRSAKAPEALLKLGMSLSALGAKDQACATFAELERKYPTAASSVKQSVDREQKRVRCPS